MCASYGLGGGPYLEGDDPGLPPMDSRDSRTLIADWMRDRDGRAAITGRRALNLNPIIRDAGSGRTLELAWWWLWVGDGPARFSAFNARDDNLLGRTYAAIDNRRRLLTRRAQTHE